MLIDLAVLIVIILAGLIIWGVTTRRKSVITENKQAKRALAKEQAQSAKLRVALTEIAGNQAGNSTLRAQIALDDYNNYSIQELEQ